jgi:phosphoserine aminotransferase
VVPLNFLAAGRSADYVVTGTWGKKALEEAQRVGKARAAWQQTDAQGRYVRVPKQAEVSFDAQACYVHTTSNNTLFGSQYWQFLDTGKLWQVCDMSSDILSRKVEVSKFGLIYAGAQKNLGPAGLVVVVVHKAFLEAASKQIPLIFRYATFAEHDSLLNTPSTFGVYMLRNCLRWLKAEGGVPGIATRNEKKAKALYAVLDELPEFYVAPVEKESRSRMNVVFHLANPALDEAFVKAAAAENMAGIKGHRSTGGMRASTYNAVTQQDVETLADFMRRFARQHG